MISAQQLPKINKDKHSSIVDPLVRVELYGVPADNASKETHYIENNGDHNTHKHSQRQISSVCHIFQQELNSIHCKRLSCTL